MSNPYDNGDKKQISVLGPTIKFKGELIAEEDLLIQGEIQGSIKHTSNLTIGDQGRLKADIEAEFILVEGKVEGDLHGSKSVSVCESADVKGNIYSPTVTLREGSNFNGQIDMSGNQQKMADVVPPKSAQENPELPAKNYAEKKPSHKHRAAKSA